MGMDPKAKSVSMSFREEYVEQLKTKEWFQKREEVLKHYGYKCALTGATGNLQIHHFEKSYKYGKKAWEYDVEDLIPLCEEEHRKMHDLYRKCPGFKVPEGEVCELIWHSSYRLCKACYFRKLDYDKNHDKLLKFIEVCMGDGEISPDEERQIIKMARELGSDMVDEAKLRIRNFRERIVDPSIGDKGERVDKKKNKVFGVSAIIIVILAIIAIDNFNNTDVDKTLYTKNFRIETASQFIDIPIVSTAIVYEVTQKKGNTYINLGGRYPNQDLSLTIFYSNRKSFHWIPKIGQKIEFKGTVSEFGGKPQIILTEQSQISLF